MRKKSKIIKFTGQFLAFMLVLAVLLFPVQTVSASAGSGSMRAVPAVSYYGRAGQFVFTPGTEENPTELFNMFQNLMPGDERVQEITLRNAAESRAPINLFLRAYVPALDDNASEAEQAEAEKVRALLEKLTITVTSDEFSDRPMLDAGSYPEQGMGSWVFLGRFEYDTASILRVEVSVPAELSDETYSENDFQDMEAAVRWAFLVEEFDDTENPGGNPQPVNPTPDNTANPIPETTQNTTVNQTPDNTAQTAVPAQNIQNDITDNPDDTGIPGAPDNPDVPELEELEDIPTPLAPPADEELGLPEEEVPLAGTGRPAWALLNLILTVVTVLACVVVILYGLKKKKEEEENAENVSAAQHMEEDGGEERKRKMAVRLLSIVPAAGSVITFLLTEDMRAPMIFADRWTWLMILIALVQAAICVVACRQKKAEDSGEKETV